MIVAVAYGVAAFIGALVGAVEIFQRYRAEPFRAIWNRWGGLYVLFNAVVAVAAFFVAARSQALATDSNDLDLLQWAATAGFGSAALLRAKLLNIRLGDGKELALGPEIVVQSFLTIIDRELDRHRGRLRFETVRKLLRGVDFNKAKVRLTTQVFQAMQTITEEETKELMKGVAEVDDLKTLDSQDKAYLLGFYLLDLVGEEFLTQILTKFGDEFRVAPAPPVVAGPPA